MTDDGTRIVNIADAELSEMGDGGKFHSQFARLGPMLGSAALGCTLTIIPPGKRAFPFHRHHVIHEMFFILTGTGEYRLDDKVLPLKPGDLVAAPAGAEAHQIVNTSDGELRFLAFSTIGEADIVEYPDTGKVAFAAGIRNADISTATIRQLGHLKPAEYFADET
jgi:uncharacterized cupin superfamily protein